MVDGPRSEEDEAALLAVSRRITLVLVVSALSLGCYLTVGSMLRSQRHTRVASDEDEAEMLQDTSRW